MDNFPKDQNSGSAPMEQVREILFGQQLKDMELRFKRQEERLIREISDAKESFKKRLDSLENFMKSEVSSLLEKLRREHEEREAAARSEIRDRTEAVKNEQRERLEAIKAEERERQESFGLLSNELSANNEALERKLAKLSETLEAAERELRSLLMSESGSLTDKIERKYADALGALSTTASQIRADMVYRTALSGMFAEIVGGLVNPWGAEKSESGDHKPQQFRPAHEYSGNNEEPSEEEEQLVQMDSADNY